MRNRAKFDGIKILLVGDVPDAHLVLRALKFFESDTTFGANSSPRPKPSKNREIRFEWLNMLGGKVRTQNPVLYSESEQLLDKSCKMSYEFSF